MSVLSVSNLSCLSLVCPLSGLCLASVCPVCPLSVFCLSLSVLCLSSVCPLSVLSRAVSALESGIGAIKAAWNNNELENQQWVGKPTHCHPIKVTAYFREPERKMSVLLLLPLEEHFNSAICNKIHFIPFILSFEKKYQWGFLETSISVRGCFWKKYISPSVLVC